MTVERRLKGISVTWPSITFKGGTADEESSKELLSISCFGIYGLDYRPQLLSLGETCSFRTMSYHTPSSYSTTTPSSLEFCFSPCVPRSASSSPPLLYSFVIQGCLCLEILLICQNLNSLSLVSVVILGTGDIGGESHNSDFVVLHLSLPPDHEFLVDKPR